VKSPTFNLWAPWRSFLVNGDPSRASTSSKNSRRSIRYPAPGRPRPAELRGHVGKPFNTDAPADYAFWELLNQVVQEEPSASLDQIRLGYYACMGIQKGKPSHLTSA